MRIAIALSVSLLVGVVCATAQSGTSLRGSITDPSGSVVPGAAVTAVDVQGLTKTVKSDGQGRYQIEGLPSGTFTLRVSSAGFSDWEQNGLTITSGKSRTLNVSLTLRSQSEHVTVAAAPGATLDTDPASNAGALVLTKTDLDSLPDDRDELAADLQALAGPAAGPNGGQIFIDGFTGGRLPPKQSIREIRINQNPFSAQFDRPGQGRIEIFTKPGTEEFHGEILFQFSDASFNSRNPFVTVKPPYQRRQWEGEVSGPINKKTSFYFAFERRDISENAIVNALVLDSSFNTVPFTQGVVTPLTGIELESKIDRQLTKNHTLSIRYQYGRDTNDNSGVGGFALPTRAYRQATHAHTIQAIETGVLNAQTVNETRFRFFKQDTDQAGVTNGPVITVLDAFSAGGSSIGDSFDHQNRYELQNSTSHIGGPHTLRWGGVVRGVNESNQAMQNYAGTFTFTSLESYARGEASQFSLVAGKPLATVNQVDFGLFVQDDWRLLNNLTLSGGLRYEAQTHASGRLSFGPRMGFAWVPHAKKGTPSKNLIRGGFGIFYDRLSESLTLTALRQNGINQQQYLIPNPDFYPMVPSAAALAAGAQPQIIRVTDSHWQSPQLIQAAIGYERQLSKYITFTTNYIHSIGNHQLRSRGINAPTNAIYLYETSGIYRQKQLNTSVTARVSSKLTFNGSYVYGRAFSNTDGAATFPANQYDLSGEYGRAAFDIRHRVRFNGSLATRWGLRFSPLVIMESGRPYNIITGTDLNGDGLYTDRPAFALNPSLSGLVPTPYGFLDPIPRPGEKIVPRNLGQGPALVTANLRISKSFNLKEPKSGKGDPRQITVSVNARNILNHPNFAPSNGNLSSPFFGHSTALISGNSASANRKIDVQMKFSF